MMLNLVLFDGVCNLCNASVDFLIRHDRQRRLRYASLQSPAGQHLLKTAGLETTSFDSFVLVQNGNVLTRSSAALRTAILLGGWFRLAGVFLLVPPFLRNPVYDLIARNRYRWFGKKESCRLPSPDERALFLETVAELSAG